MPPQFPSDVNNNDAHINFDAQTYTFVAPDGNDAGLIEKKGTSLWGCSLYVPGGVQEMLGTNWQGESVAHALNQGNGLDTKSMSASIAAGAANKLGSGTVAASTAAAGLGKALAPNEVMIFRGARHRTLMLQFEMVPKNVTEATAIKDIIQGFREYALPEFKTDNDYIAYLEFPPLWDIEIFAKDFSNALLKTYNPSKKDIDFIQYQNMALTEVAVAYSSGHQAMIMFEDGSPISTSLTLQFTSVRPALRGNLS
jgi:hypothetical protein